MQPIINVLMTGAGAPGAPGIIKCLLQEDWINLTVGDGSEEATGRFLHHDFVPLPKAADVDFVQKVLSICAEKNIQVLLPLVTKELLSLAENKYLFTAAGVEVLVSSKEAIQTANNKSTCYQFLQAKGIAVPKFDVVTTVNGFIQAAHNLGYPGKDFCFKPSLSNGSRGFRIVSATINEADFLFSQKPYQTYLSWDNAVRILESQPFPELLVSEYLPGREYSVDCLANNGKAVLVVPRLRSKMINGISVQGEFVYHKEIVEYCTKIIEIIGLHGNIGIQVKESDSGEPLLLEINPRVQGTIVAALGAGVNLPILAVKQSLGNCINPEAVSIKWGTRFSRYWTEVFY